jgi:NADH-quinone oxidoreductase subunit L
MLQYQTALALGVLIPLISFAVLALFGHRLGKPVAAYVALLAIGISCGLGSYALVGWLGESAEGRAALAAGAYRFDWGTMGSIPIMVGVKIDSLTVIMYFMVTFVSFWIFFFSIGYMEGHSDEVDGVSKYHRFFTYLSLFGFSMLGLVVSSSLLFLFIFWELVGLCSYLLIGFYFDKKFASDAAIKAFVTNRVGDFGFIIGLALVVVYLGTFDLDDAARAFAAQFHGGTGIFASTYTLFGFSLATLMGIGLFCGAMGKSAQFPLHVWLPDAMAGPTPVSALIHAATMVAAGVYLVARVFRLLTPEAQFFIAVIGCITLTITALIAIVQTDIKKVLAYSTLSQLGYMIFGMGVGAWIAALFHLMTHAFFKAMLFLGSGQVIEGCHHEQDIRKMGGLRKKMPVTCWTFFIGLLAIAGFGIPGWQLGPYKIGLGGFFSKDEILAVAYERAFNLPHGSQTDAAADDAGEHAMRSGAGAPGGEPIRLATAAHGADALHAVPAALLASADEEAHAADGDSHATGTAQKQAIALRLPKLPAWMFYLPIAIAYVTPFYMMRCWWLTFCGKPRDAHVHEHAHENWKMYVPLAILAAGTVWCSYSIFRPLIADAAAVATNCPTVVAIDGEAHSPAEAGGGAMLTLTHAAGRDPHQALVGIVGFAWIIGMGAAVVIYRRGLELGERFKRMFGAVHAALDQKLYFDHVYNALLVGGTITFGYVAGLFDKIVIDGAVNLVGLITRAVGSFTGRQLDMPVERGDWGIVDAVANGMAATALDIGTQIRRPQSGRIRTYVCIATGAAAIALLAVLFFDRLADGYNWIVTQTTAVAQTTP